LAKPMHLQAHDVVVRFKGLTALDRVGLSV
jgi:hypothetical protein